MKLPNGAAVEGSRRPLQTSDIHWLAGLMEGEGHFCLNGASPRMTVAMTDRDVIDRAARVVDGGSIHLPPPQRPHHKQSHYLIVSGSRAAGWMMTLYPLLGMRRQGRIREVLTAWRLRPVQNQKKTHCNRGHEFTPENTYLFQQDGRNGRQCIACRRVRGAAWMRSKRAEATA